MPCWSGHSHELPISSHDSKETPPPGCPLAVFAAKAPPPLQSVVFNTCAWLANSSLFLVFFWRSDCGAGDATVHVRSNWTYCNIRRMQLTFSSPGVAPWKLLGIQGFRACRLASNSVYVFVFAWLPNVLFCFCGAFLTLQKT